MISSRTDRLQAQLEAYVSQDLYPFHMPGHKRLCSPAAGLPYQTDLTEVEGVDDLHHAQGILRAAMDRTAALFGSSRCWYLVGGSTVGNLAGIRAIAPYGSEVIVARNCHKSVYHAIELCHLKVHWIWPSWDTEYEIFGSVAPETVARALAQYPASCAVILTSPTYEGVVSDIQTIAELCHRHRGAGIPLLVDEAHGAHLGLFERDFFPDSAIHCGADVVIQSAHKTLPSLTQTALLHQRGLLVSPGKIEAQLDVFETSSPSYPLMASLDGCTGLLKEKGASLFHQWRVQLETFSAALRKQPLRQLQVRCGGKGGQQGVLFALDPGKILIRGRSCSGEQLAKALRMQGIETEMHIGRNVLCMTSCADTEEGFDRLQSALYRIDEELERQRADDPINHRLSTASEADDPINRRLPTASETDDPINGRTSTASTADERISIMALSESRTGERPSIRTSTENGTEKQDDNGSSAGSAEIGAAHDLGNLILSAGEFSQETDLSLGDAVRQKTEQVPIGDCEGRLAGEYIYPYPPGIPVVVPGEVLTKERIEILRQLLRQGAAIRRSSQEQDPSKIVCLE